MIEIFANLHFNIHHGKNTCTKENETNTVINIPICLYLEYEGNDAYCMKTVRENKLY